VGDFSNADIFEEESQNQTKVFAVRWRLEPKSMKMLKTRKGRSD
jgi:hypothetical protein